MEYLRNANVKQKLLLLLIAPLSALILFEGLNIQRHYQDLNSMAHVVDLAELSGINSELAHELQKERGMSAGYLGSGGRNFVNELIEQLQRDRLWLLQQLDQGRWPELRLDLAALERELGQLLEQAQERLSPSS